MKFRRKTELEKAYEYEIELQKKGIIKDIKTYNAMLDEYAAIRGYWGFDDMIHQLTYGE